MHAKAILTVLFLLSLGVAAVVLFNAMSKKPVIAAATAPVVQDEILAAAIPLAPGTLLRDQDVAWQPIMRRAEPEEFVRPPAAQRSAKPELDQEARAAVYGAAARLAIAAGAPIRRDSIVKPGDRDFLQVVLSPGARAIAIPVATGGASTGLLYPGDRVDVILTQKFADSALPLTRRSVSETVVENLRVLAIDALDAKAPAGAGAFGRTVTLEVTPVQAEKINVATDLGTLSLTLRSASGASSLVAAAKPGPGNATEIKPTWAGDVSPALGGAMPPEKQITAEQPPVSVLHGVARSEQVKE